MTEENKNVDILVDHRKVLLEDDIPKNVKKLTANYIALRELHKAHVQATIRLEKNFHNLQKAHDRLENQLENANEALAIKNRVMEQMVEGHTKERGTFAAEIKDLKKGNNEKHRPEFPGA